jgi:DNA-binding LytR/AlgR family response regulator
MTTTAIIVDDEPHLVDYLSTKLSELWPDLEIVGTALNGRQAVSLAEEKNPDIAFLDIHMPGLSGLQVAQALSADIKVVFVTAFDEYAVDAFQRAAIDYLLKPVSDTRLMQTIERLRAPASSDRNDLLNLIRDISQEQNSYLQWIRVGLDDTTQLVPVSDVIYFKADLKYTEIFTRDGGYIVRRSIKELESQLDPNQFWRIHRGVIVRVEQIAAAKRDFRGRYTIALRDHPDVLRTSQSYGHLFKHM